MRRFEHKLDEMSVDASEFITIDVAIKGPVLAANDFTLFMMTRDHWTRMWPDARERWAWLSFLQRCGERVTSGSTPRLICADGVARKWTFTEMAASHAVLLAMMRAGLHDRYSDAIHPAG